MFCFFTSILVFRIVKKNWNRVLFVCRGALIPAGWKQIILPMKREEPTQHTNKAILSKDVLSEALIVDLPTLIVRG